MKHLSTEGCQERRNLAKRPGWEGGLRLGKSGHQVVMKAFAEAAAVSLANPSEW